MRLTEQEAESQRQRIIEEAHKVFMDNGYVATKTEVIAQKAGISRSPLYYYFKNKQVLFQTVVEYHFDTLEQMFHKIFSQDKPILKLVEEDLLQTLQATGEGYISKDIESFTGGIDERVIKEHIDRIFLIKLEAVERAVADGQLKPGTDAREFVQMVFTVYYGLTGISNSGIVERKNAKKIVENFISMLANTYLAAP